MMVYFLNSDAKIIEIIITSKLRNKLKLYLLRIKYKLNYCYSVSYTF